MSQIIKLDSYGGAALLTVTGDTGGAISTVGNNINILGGSNISTVGTAGTITIKLDSTTDHAVQLGNAAGSLTSLGLGTATYVLTSNGPGLDPSWQSVAGSTTYHTDAGDAAEAASAITFTGGNNIATSGAGSIVTIDLDGTTDHSLIIGNASGSISSLGVATDGQIAIGSTGSDPVLANITSSGGFLDITNGAGTINIEIDDDAQDVAIHSWNGCFLNSVRGIVSESGGVVSVAIDKAGGGDLKIVFSSDFYDWDTTPAVSVNLTVGTDSSPQMNHVYFDKATSALLSSTAGWPATEHAPIGRILVPSAALVATSGPYILHQQSTETYDPTSNMGHIIHISEWIRSQHATWESGVAQTLTITPNGAAKDNVIFSSTSGVVMQLHDKTFPSFAGGEYYVVNDSVTAYKKISDINSIDTDSDGATLIGRYFTIVIWGSSSGNGTSEKLFINLPAGSYSTANYAKKDARKEANYSIPSDFKGVGFLIASYVLYYSTAASGTWTNILFTDLRGLYPSITAGGSTDYPSEFSDDVFRINDDSDATKQLAFQVSPVTTSTTRTITMCDADLDLTSPSFGGSVTAATGLTVTANDVTISSGKLAMPATTSFAGYIYIGGYCVLHAYGTDNIYVGRQASSDNGGTGTNNVAIGAEVFSLPSTGSYNTFINAARNTFGYLGSESSNLMLSADLPLGTNNTIIIGTQGTGNGQQNKTYIAGIYGVTPSGTKNIAYIDSNHQLGSVATVGVANGGTGVSTLLDHGVMLGSGTGAISVTAVGTADQVLTSNGAGSDPTFQDAASPLITLNDQTGTSYTLVLTDASKLVTCSNAAAITLTIPPNSTTAFDIGTQILLYQGGAGTVTITAGTGVTIRSADSLLDTYTQYSLVSIIKVASDEWLLSGDLA